jgi:DNA-binding transcriptional LysR family regulator
MDIRKLDLNLLVTLEALLAEGNVTRAARRLGLSQPAVSTQLARLRDLLGDPLLVPARRGMVPTSRALELRQPLLDALDGLRDIVAVGQDFDPATAAMTVAIAGSDHTQYAWLMPFATALRAKAPGLRLALRPSHPETLARQLEQGEVDLAIYPSPYASPALLTRKFRDERYVLIARQGHPVAQDGIGLERFLELEHVIVEPSAAQFRGPTDALLAQMGRVRRIVMSVSSFLVAAEVVAQTDLVSIIPEGITRDRKDRLRVITPPLAIPDIELLLLWHQRTHSQAAYRWIRDTLVAATGSGDGC